jgi:tRNA modification GTPase
LDTEAVVPLRVALLTPPGRGALAVVGVAGPRAVAAVAHLFHPRGKQPLLARPAGSIAFGRWADPTKGEELVVVRRTADSLEVHCHGGLAASEAVMASLESLGAVREPWPAWLHANGAAMVEVEAREALAKAGGPKAAQILSRQLAGALQAEFDRIAALKHDGSFAAARAAVDRLRRASRVGLRLTRPWRVVVSGPTNVGKSSLVNALSGYTRSIVSPEPGTTRDVLETRIVLDGWEIDLVDTAGLRGGDAADVSATEQAGIGRAVAAAAAADLVVHVSRAGTGNGPLRSAATVPDIPTLHVVSQCDLAPDDTACPAGGIRTSAVTGAGLDSLAAAIIRLIVPEAGDDPSLLAGAVPFTPRQCAALDELA